jgi:drug/metabolite transporter (DMT)-like permease
LLYLAIVGSVVAYSAYVHLVANVRPSLALSYAYVNPAIAVALGALIGGETVTTNLLIALPVIVVGVAIVTWSQGASRAGAPR